MYRHYNPLFSGPGSNPDSGLMLYVVSPLSSFPVALWGSYQIKALKCSKNIASKCSFHYLNCFVPCGAAGSLFPAQMG